MQNRICIILVNYNGYLDTIECVESIRRNTIHSDIIIVDNASKYNDYEKLLSLYSNDGNIILLKNNKNIGFAGGNNIAINYAIKEKYEYIILLNNDTIVSNDMIELLVKETNCNTITIPLMYYYNEPKTIWFGGGKLSKFTGNGKSMFKGIDGEKYIHSKPFKCTFATGCCMSIKTETLLNVGLLDESYFMYCEDTDFCIRLLENHVSILLVPKARLWHKVSQSTGGEDSSFSLYYINRNRLNYVRKYRKMFWVTAYPFSILSRYIRFVQYRIKKPELASYIGKAIKDHRKNKYGKANL